SEAHATEHPSEGDDVSAGFEIAGLKELQKKLGALPDRVQRKVMRPAVSAAATPIAKTAKQKAKKRSGLLKKSIGKKVVTNKRAGSVSAVTGPRKNVTAEIDGKTVRASRYAHLVEKGFIDEHGEHHAPQPFMNPALDEAGGQALGIMATKLG